MNASVIRTSLRVSDQQEPEDQDGCGPEERDESKAGRSQDPVAIRNTPVMR